MHQFITGPRGFTETLDERTCETIKRLGLIVEDGPPQPAAIGDEKTERDSMTQYWKQAPRR